MEAQSLSPPLEEPIRIRHRVEYGLYRIVQATIAWFSPKARRALARVSARIALLVDRKHRKVAFENVARALPELDASKHKAIVQRSFVNMASTLLETLARARSSREELTSLYEVEGWEHLEEAESKGKGVLLLTAHLGAWESLAQFMAIHDKPLWFVARPMDNPLLEKEVRQLRERFGNKTILKRSGARPILRALRSAARVALLTDQRVHPNEGKAYPFFGIPAYTTPLPARLALRTGAPAVPFFAIPIDGSARIRVEFWEPIYPCSSSDDEDSVERMTVEYLAAQERAIRAHPGLWLWMHRRWRKNPTTIFKRRVPRHAAGPEGEPVQESPAPSVEDRAAKQS